MQLLGTKAEAGLLQALSGQSNASTRSVQHSGHTSENGPVTVTFVQSASENVETLRENSKKRLASLPWGRVMTGVVAGILVIPFGMTKLALGLTLGIVGQVVGRAVKFVEDSGIISSLNKLRSERAALHAYFSSQTQQEKCILGEKLSTVNGEEISVGEALEKYRLTLDGRISSEEMTMYVALGEALITELTRDESDGVPPVTLRAANGDPLRINGREVRLESDRDTARAISWYTYAKAIADNHRASEAPIDLNSPSVTFVIPDSGNRVGTFLSASDNAYGRCSTHMKEFTQNRDSSFAGGMKALWEGGFAAAFAYAANGQPLQRGIEDADNKLPGPGGGAVLFASIYATNGTEAALMLKPESGGMPTTLGLGGRNADLADGWGERILGTSNAVWRCLGHTLHFVKDSNPGHYRGEKPNKGVVGKILKDATTRLVEIAPDRRSMIVGNIEKSGFAGTFTAAENILDTKGHDRPSVVDPIAAVMKDVTAASTDLGTAAPHERIGSEVRLHGWRREPTRHAGSSAPSPAAIALLNGPED
ncbi:MAG: hypothetical protein ACOYJQ_13525 [Pseudochelatococcus sp.]|uniref:hypothetical protein n=1 Tax=Pseudochelatococcus sp. TaxID=2020869 RepID=UPI003D92EFDA